MPIDMPPLVAVSITAPRPAGVAFAPHVFLQDPQKPLQIPQADLFVEVVGEVPIRAKLADVSRLLAQRHKTASINRTYPPTILELITLVKRNPARPPGRPWNSIRELTIGYKHETSEVIVEYCLDYCTPDPETNSPHPRRRMASYSAPEGVVVKRLNKKLGDLKKYSERFD